jgi:hypothetical protein
MTGVVTSTRTGGSPTERALTATPGPDLVRRLKSNRMRGSVRWLNGRAVNGKIGLRISAGTAAIASRIVR